MNDYIDIYHRVTPGDVVLTVNNRLATYCHQGYLAYQCRLGKTAFETPYISKFSSWIESLWINSAIRAPTDSATLLTHFQTNLVWKTLIAENGMFIHQRTIEQQAIEAWNLCHQWLINYHSEEFKQFTEHQSWQSWAMAFEQTCQANHWIDQASLIQKLIQQDRLSGLILPKNVFLVGFDELNPQYYQFIQYLEQQGCQIHWNLHPIYNSVLTKQESCSSSRRAGGEARSVLGGREHCSVSIDDESGQEFRTSIQHLALADTETELYTMARWAYHAWQQDNLHIGCVIPQLTTLRTRVISIFQEVYLGMFKHPVDSLCLPFNLSGGMPLIHHPMIRIIMDILTLDTEIELIQCSRLVRSPYIGQAPQEKFQRTKLDVLLRKRCDSTLTMETFIALSQQAACPALNLMLTLYDNTHQTQRLSKQLPSQWAHYFATLLSLMGWPGTQSLSSEEFQWMERWSRLLDEFAQLDLVLSPIEGKLALRYLMQIATDTLFQPKPQKQAHPIQILGLLEAASLNFDQVWVMGLEDTVWPPSAEPNPFIPYHLQRLHQMPHASHTRQHHFSQLITERLSNSAPIVIFSYPTYQGDQPLNPSPLILPPVISGSAITSLDLALPVYSSPIAQIADQFDLEQFQDDIAPPITEPASIKGGARLFKTQAACPFRAFADYRLMLAQEPLKLPQSGLTASERGQLVHRALEAVWRLLENQALLNQYSEETLDQLLNQIIQEILEKESKKRPALWKKKFKSLEAQRLHRLIKQWLTFEKTRPPFKIFALEREQTYTLAELELKLIIDRIDQLETGETILIDYKTSTQLSCQDWFGDRLEEPQLPLYSLSLQSTPHALSYVQLIPKHSGKFYGLSAKELYVVGITPIKKFINKALINDWKALLEHWHTVLHSLAEQFKQGVAHVDPKSINTTCRSCDRSLLCRIKAKLPHFEKDLLNTL